VAEVQLDRLWMSFNEIARPEEKGTAISSIVGLQCGDRAMVTFRNEHAAGVRDAIVVYEDHLVMVNTPRALSVGTLLDVLRTQGPRNVVKHVRMPLDEIVTLEVTSQPPPAWRMTGARFVHLEVKQGYVWFWIDDEVMYGRKRGDLETAIAHWTAKGAPKSAAPTHSNAGDAGVTGRVAFCSSCGAPAKRGRFCAACGAELD
jgi:hypothetical protein